MTPYVCVYCDTVFYKEPHESLECDWCEGSMLVPEKCVDAAAQTLADDIARNLIKRITAK